MKAILKLSKLVCRPDFIPRLIAGDPTMWIPVGAVTICAIAEAINGKR